MANYPSSLDSLSNPVSTQTLAAMGGNGHNAQHTDLNNIVTALEVKVGVNGSAVNTTQDFKLSGVATGDKAASLTGTETLTNKALGAGSKYSLGSDATGDTYYRNSGGVTTRLPIGATGNILNVDGTGIPAWIANPSAADASTVPVKGVVVLATQAKVDTADDTNATTAKNVVTPSTLRARLINSGVQDTGSSTAYILTPSPVATSYVTFQEYTFKAAATNTTTTPTVNVNGLGAKTIVNPDGSALFIGQIVLNGVYRIVYDGTNMQLVSQAQNPVNFGQASRTSGTGTGTQTIAHGLGQVPRLFKVWYSSNSGNNSAWNTGSGTGNSTSNYSFTTNCASNAANANGVNTVQGTSGIIRCYASDGTTVQVAATISAIDATNVTLNFTTMSFNVYFQWEAWA